MAGSVNKVVLIGNLGQDPKITSFESGGQIATFSIATSETWKDKNSGERKEKTDWHNIVVNNESMIKVCQNYLKKGSKVYLEGKLRNRKYTDKDGIEKYTTEVLLGGYNSQLVLLDKKEGGDNRGYESEYGGGDNNQAPQQEFTNDLEDEIPF